MTTYMYDHAFCKNLCELIYDMGSAAL